MRYLSIITFILLTNIAYAQLENRYIRQGVDEYKDKQYGNAEVSYQKALEKNANSYAAQFNLGDAFYKQEKYDEASKEFASLVDKTTDKQKLSQLYYNIGNSQLKKVEKILQEQKLDEAIKQIDKSIGAYKNSLKNNSTNKNAKYNLAYAKKLKELLEQQQQQNKQQNKQNQQNKDQNQDQNKQNQDQNNQQNQNKPNKGDSDGDGIPDDVEKGDNPDKPRDTDNDGTPDHQDSDSDNDGKPDSEEAGQNPKKPQDTDKDGLPDYRDLDSNNDGKPDSEDNKKQQEGKISKEDALRLLQAMEDDEKNVQDKLKRVKGVRVKKEKDW